MKKSKILVPAVALLALSTAAATTGTVAWFSANTVVAGSGMQVQCITAKDLVISNAQAGTYGVAAVTANTGAKTLTPASTHDTVKFFTIDNTNIEYASGQAKVGSVITDVTATGANTYFAKHSFWVKINGATDATVSNVVLKSLVVSAPTLEISKSLRVAAVTADETNIYSVTGGETTYNAVLKAGTVAHATGTSYGIAAGGDAVTSVTAKTAVSDSEIYFTSLGTTAKQIDFYVWYEGQDANCKSANAIASESLSVSFTLSYLN